MGYGQMLIQEYFYSPLILLRDLDQDALCPGLGSSLNDVLPE